MSGVKTITGEHILAARLFLELENCELARDVGIGVSTISRWENGHTSPNHFYAQAMDGYFRDRIGKDWKTHVVKTDRFKAERKYRALAEKKGVRVCTKAFMSAEDINRLHKELLKRGD